MKKHYYIGVDLVRAASLLLVLIYHIWVLSGSLTSTHISVLDKWVALGGEIGVTGFFCISGFGIYWSLKGNTNGYFGFLKKRLRRIVPQYYTTLIVVLLLGGGVGFLSREYLKLVLSHFVFLQNANAAWGGAIVGALWTMAVIVQFYLISPVMYKILIKIGILMPVLAIIITVVSKYYLFNSQYYLVNSFWVSRQFLVTTLDNFAVGMYTAYLLDKEDVKENSRYILGIVVGVVLISVVNEVGLKNGIHTCNWSGYMWHSMLALCVGLMLYSVSITRINGDNRIIKAGLWVSKYEYGIYLWHLVIIRNLVSGSGLYNQLVSLPHGIWCGYLILIALSMGCGYFSTRFIDKK